VRRFVAITASVVMICVAIVIRSNIDDGDSGKTPAPTGPVTIACVTELANQCRALKDVQVRIEDASVTAKALARGNSGISGWVTFDPWPAIVDELAGASVTGESARLTSSALVIAMASERADALAPTCGGAITWKCVGDAIGNQWTDVGGRAEWGQFRAGIPPTSSGLGLLMLGNAASGYFGRTDFATNDFDDAFAIWRANVTAASASFARFIIEFPAGVSAVGSTQQEVTAGKGSRAVTAITPTPAASAVIVLTQVNDKRVRAIAGELTGLLRDGGWLEPPPDSAGLPNPGVLLALSGLTR
jgi:hypothetical protein